MKNMIWNENYFSKFEFVIHCGCEIVGYFECNLMMSELSYQECGNTWGIVFEHSRRLSEKELTKLLPYVCLSDYERYRRDRIPLEEKKIVGVRDVFSITFKGYSQDGQALLTYEMEFVYNEMFSDFTVGYGLALVGVAVVVMISRLGDYRFHKERFTMMY
ncbi:TPA: hypothetical protein ACGORU_001818 [Streptococcus suis]